MLSPARFVMMRAQINREIEAVRKDRDIPAMQRGLRKLTSLRALMFGGPRLSKKRDR